MPKRSKPKRQSKRTPSIRRTRTKAKTELHEEFHFANRELELDFLRAKNHFNFYQIYAPAGYGKTTLLWKLKTEFERERDWVALWISYDPNQRRLKPKHEKGTVAQAQKTYAETVGDLLRWLGKEPEGNGEDRLEQLIAKVSSKARHGRETKVVIFIDAIERAAIEVLEDIVEKLIPAFKETSGIAAVKVYFTSRFKIVLNLGGEYRPYLLSQFGRDSLVQVIAERDPDEHMPSEQRVQFADSLLGLCLGHPKCVSEIYKRVGKYPRLSNGKLKDERKLFDIEVRKVINEEILEDAKQHVGLEALKDVFILRRLLLDDLVEFFSDDPWYKQYSLEDIQNRYLFLSQKLMETGLFTPPDISGVDAYTSDPVVRHFFATEMYYEDLNAFHKRHRKVLEVYENRMINVNSSNPVSGLNQIRLIVEVLYHLLRVLMASKDDPQRKFDLVLNKLNAWRPHWRTGGTYPSQHYRSQLLEAIKIDVDLPFLFRNLIGSERYNLILEAIEHPEDPKIV